MISNGILVCQVSLFLALKHYNKITANNCALLANSGFQPLCVLVLSILPCSTDWDHLGWIFLSEQEFTFSCSFDMATVFFCSVGLLYTGLMFPQRFWNGQFTSKWVWKSPSHLLGSYLGKDKLFLYMCMETCNISENIKDSPIDSTSPMSQNKKTLHCNIESN